MAHAPAAPGVDPHDQQVPARADGTGGLAQQAMGRQAEVQAMLQHHHVGSVLAQRPGLFFADNLHTRQGRTKAHVTLHLGGSGRWLGAGPVMHEIAAKEAPELFFQQFVLLLEHQLPKWAVEPLTGQADQLDPVRVGLCKSLVGHCALPRRFSHRAIAAKMPSCATLGESDPHHDTDRCSPRFLRQLHLVVTGYCQTPLCGGRPGRCRPGGALAGCQPRMGAERHPRHPPPQ
ncbi:hypothetical protein D3C76_947110 [compost metagenome]